MTTTPQAALLSEADMLDCLREATHEIPTRIPPGWRKVMQAAEKRILAKLQDGRNTPFGREAEKLADNYLDLQAQYADAVAKLQATQEPVQAGELPDEREAFEQWWRQRQLLTFPKDYDQSRLADWGAAYKPAAKDAWQARAALSARKPLTMLEPTQIADACAGIYASDHAGKAYDQAVAIAAITEFCRINGIGLEVKP